MLKAILKHIMLLSTVYLILGTSVVFAYTDVQPYDDYYYIIDWAEQNDIASGYKDGTFRPDDEITVGEAYAMIYRAFAEEEAEEYSFSDHWAAKYMYAVSELKWQDRHDSLNRPDNKATLGPSLSTLMTAADIQIHSYKLFDNIPESISNTIIYRNCLSTAYSMGLINETDIENETITRKRFCELIYNIANKQYKEVDIPDYIKNMNISYYNLGNKLSREKFTSLEEALIKVPPFIINEFNSSNWKMCLVEGDLADTLNLDIGSADGVTDYKNSRIGINTKFWLDVSTVQHEFGHFTKFKYYNSEYNSKYTDSYFEKIFNKEADALSKIKGWDYCKKTSGEFFAEAFEYYLSASDYGHEKFREECPMVYDIIDNIVTTGNNGGY